MSTIQTNMQILQDSLIAVPSQQDFTAELHPHSDHMKVFSQPKHKTSFLVFKHNKYFTVPIDNIAYFYVKYNAAIIVCFDRQEYFVSHSLEQIQNLICGSQFFRLNRQYLVNFKAIKDVEHYFARKLLVNLAVPVAEKLLVTKEKSRAFIHWLDNR